MKHWSNDSQGGSDKLESGYEEAGQAVAQPEDLAADEPVVTSAGVVESSQEGGGSQAERRGQRGGMADSAGQEPAMELEVLEAVPEDALAAAQRSVAETREQMLRIAADFDNYRKRSRREMDDARHRAKEELLRELLPVFDNLERAAAHASQASDVHAMAEGVNLVLKQFWDTGAKLGLRRVESVGKPFDPSVHEAIQQMESVEHPPGTVMVEVLPGYVWGDRLVRAAMVIVAKAPDANRDGPTNGTPN